MEWHSIMVNGMAWPHAVWPQRPNVEINYSRKISWRWDDYRLREGKKAKGWGQASWWHELGMKGWWHHAVSHAATKPPVTHCYRAKGQSREMRRWEDTERPAWMSHAREDLHNIPLTTHYYYHIHHSPLRKEIKWDMPLVTERVDERGGDAKAKILEPASTIGERRKACCRQSEQAQAKWKFLLRIAPDMKETYWDAENAWHVRQRSQSWCLRETWAFHLKKKIEGQIKRQHWMNIHSLTWAKWKERHATVCSARACETEMCLRKCIRAHTHTWKARQPAGRCACTPNVCVHEKDAYKPYSLNRNKREQDSVCKSVWDISPSLREIWDILVSTVSRKAMPNGKNVPHTKEERRGFREQKRKANQNKHMMETEKKAKNETEKEKK